MKALKPTLIQYSSPSHRQGLRKYFQGQYRLDYGNHSPPKDYSKNSRFVLQNNRCRTENSYQTDRYLYSLEKSSPLDKCGVCSSRYVKEGQDKQFQSNNPEQKTLNIKSQSINLPKISNKLTTEPNSPPKSQKKSYICGDINCPTKSHESLIIPKKKKKINPNIKPRQLKIPAIPDVRRRYTPTFVCSRDNPMPCFKVYDL